MLKFFQNYIQIENGIKKLIILPPTALSESQRNIRDNAVAFMQRLQQISERERISLGEYLVSNCFVVVVSTGDLNTACRIFSVLNDRGRNLSYADILKAQIINDIPAEEQEEYTNKWEEVEVLLGHENFQNLLMHIRILQVPNAQKFMEEFHMYVYPNAAQKKTAQQLIDYRICKYGRILYTITTAHYKDVQYATEIEKLLRWLNRLSRQRVAPAALQYWGRNENNPDMLLRFLHDLDRLQLRMSAAEYVVQQAYRTLLSATNGDQARHQYLCRYFTSAIYRRRAT